MSLEGFENLMKKLDKLGNSKEVVKRGMDLAVKKVKDDAKELAAVDSGDLRQRIYSKVEEKGNEVIGTIFSNVPQAV